jgi:precorrin-8X/cobalt-precorrin-8 methylmutase
MSRAVHPIEAESYRILRRLVDLSGLPPLSRAVAERVVHATADPAWAADLLLDEAALAAGRAALLAGAPLVTDVRMVAAGITTRPALCALGLEGSGEPRRGAPEQEGSGGAATRVAAGIQAAVHRVGPGAVWVVGCAPTALARLLDLDAAPALVVGLPVGFVGAVEAKRALAASGLPALTNRSARGGAAVAAAAVNALLYHHQAAGR